MSSRFAVIALCAALAAAAAPAGAQQAWTNFVKVQTCGDVLALADTVWLATGEAGLVRYLRSSGRFEFITREPGGLASNDVTAIAFDRSGRLWAGTPGRGASRLSADGSTWGLVNEFDGLPSDSVNVLRATGDSLWIGTSGGLALWDGEQVAGSVPDIGTASPFRSNFVSGVAVLGDSVYVATHDGVYLGRLSQGLTSWPAVDTGLADPKVLALATDGREVFALAGSTLYRLDRATSLWSVNAPGGTSALHLRDDFGRMTCGTPAGLYRWTGAAWSLLSGSPPVSEPFPGETEFAVDPSGTTFAFRRGLLSWQGAPWPSAPVPGPVDNNLQHVVLDGTRVWVNSNDEGVSRFDGQQWRNWPASCCGVGQDTAFVNPVSAFALHRDGSGRKWIAFWGTAVERIDDSVDPPHVERVILPGADSLYNHTAMWASAHDDSGYVYLGGDTWDRGGRPPVGIDVFAPDGSLLNVWKSANTGLPDNQVRAIAIDGERDRLWAGVAGNGFAYTGLVGYGKQDSLPRFTKIADVDALALDVFGMEIYGDTLWVLGTTGLQRRSAATGSLFATYDLPGAPAPLGAMRPLAISPDGSAWVASVDGVRRYRRGGGFDDYRTSNSPLLDNEVRAIAIDPATGVVWFATRGGLSRFDPGWTEPAPPVIPALSIRVYPNPAQFPAVGLDLKLSGNAAAYSGTIYDLAGRVVHRFESHGDGRIVWDGRDLEGRRVRPGVYFVRARGGGHEASARVVVLR